MSLSWGDTYETRMVDRTSHNKQLERTIMPYRERTASAPFHCAHAGRWTTQRAALN